MARATEKSGNDWWAGIHRYNAEQSNPARPAGSEKLSDRLSASLEKFAFATVDQILICRALILRNLRLKYLNNPLGFVLEFLRPVVVDAAHYFYFQATNRPVPGHQYAVFTIAGFAIWFLFSATMGAAENGAAWPAGVLGFPGVSRMNLRVAAAAWSFFLYVFFAFAWVLPLMAYGADLRFPVIPITVFIYFVTATMGFGYGLTLEGLCRYWPAMKPFMDIFIWIVFITSGVYDSLTLMPRVMAKIIWYNPMIHLAEFARQAYWSAYPVYLVNMIYPICWAAGILFLGLLVNRWLRRTAHT